MTHRTTTYLLPGIHVTDHTVDVPLDWRRPDDGRTISLFARDKKATREVTFVLDGPNGVEPVTGIPDDVLRDALAAVR